MEFSQTLVKGYFIKRYKRFLTDIKLENGKVVTAHCPNSGSMRSCLGTYWPTRLSTSDNPQRKLKYTLEMLYNGKTWIGVNTYLANQIVAEAISKAEIKELIGYTNLTREVKYGQNSRIDILLENEEEKCYVEVKNVTLVEAGNYLFPDAPTQRGQKHLHELMQMKKQGHRAVMFYLIQRQDGKIFAPASHIDPEYSKLLKQAYKQGVEILPYRTKVSPEKITLANRIEFKL
ncbi:MAG TPA: DNA/RNA nuclease SfsA [Candidatus Cloacimonas sp.]|nr:sugar fermentation stimulation protein [Candidatus Cloacimonadota bacterium]HCX73082.1 DNA/RNA nuclease SfsA [Candidatus Cloacimonas sp.]